LSQSKASKTALSGFFFLPLLAVAVNTLGDSWRHRGDFSISNFNPPAPSDRPILYQNLRKKKIFNFFGFGGGLKGFRVEIEKSPRWRHFYFPAIVEID